MKRILSAILLGLMVSMLFGSSAFAENRLGVSLGGTSVFYHDTPGSSMNGDRFNTSFFNIGVNGEWDFAPDWFIAGAFIWGAPGSFNLSTNQTGGTAATYSATSSSSLFDNVYAGWRFWNIGTGAVSGAGNNGASTAVILGWEESSTRFTLPYTLTAGNAAAVPGQDYSISAGSLKVGFRGDLVSDPWYGYLETSWLPSVSRSTVFAQILTLQATTGFTGVPSASGNGAGISANAGTFYKFAPNWSIGVDYYFMYVGIDYQRSPANGGVNHVDETTSAWIGSINYHW